MLTEVFSPVIPKFDFTFVLWLCDQGDVRGSIFVQVSGGMADFPTLWDKVLQGYLPLLPSFIVVFLGL
ncbi:hypothetical protein [Porphyromonas gulae]|uniref:hypothetical protein n=1 Tax=Porphyromonas gulae TaxID=111105 RepID=UPI0026EA93CD|nr:hypothetical protein [Porphyromonas gulae]